VDMTSAGSVLAVPTDPAELEIFLKEQVRKIVTKTAIACAIKPNGSAFNSSNRNLTAAEEEDLLTVLLALSNIEGLTKALAQKINLRKTLEVVLNKVTGPRRYVFPASAVEIAQQAYDRYEREGWGADPENDLNVADDRDAPSPPPTRRRFSATINNEVPQKRITLPPPDHPIYGSEGIMRHILVQHGKTTSYQFGKSVLL
jgi:hypothetical protein